MRYTNIVDLREWESIYNNKNARLVYLHLVLSSGYKSYNNGMLITSYSKLSEEIGVTVSAVRHALDQLQRQGFVKKELIKARYSQQLKLYIARKVKQDGHKNQKLSL